MQNLKFSQSWRISFSFTQTSQHSYDGYFFTITTPPYTDIQEINLYLSLNADSTILEMEGNSCGSDRDDKDWTVRFDYYGSLNTEYAIAIEYFRPLNQLFIYVDGQQLRRTDIVRTDSYRLCYGKELDIFLPGDITPVNAEIKNMIYEDNFRNFPLGGVSLDELNNNLVC